MKRRDKATTNRAGALQVEVALELPKRRRLQRADPGPRVQPALTGHIPRITRLMALANKLQEMVDCGRVRDYADIARLGYVTRARLTQIMSLLLLAPDIQDEILRLSESPKETHLAERQLRSLTKLVLWEDQRQTWKGRHVTPARPLP